MRNIIFSVAVFTVLTAGSFLCCGGPNISITKSNTNVVITWAQPQGDWRLVKTSGLDYYYSSNGALYKVAYPQTFIPTSKYETNGANISVVLPVSSANTFFMLQTNL